MAKDSREERILRLIKNMEIKIVQLSKDGSKKQLQQLIFDKNAFESKIARLENEIQEVLIRNETLENSNTTIKELEKELSHASDDIVNLNNLISELKIQNQGFENKITNWVNEKRQYQITLKQSREMIELEKEKNAEIRRTIRRLERRLLRGGRISSIHIAVDDSAPETDADAQFEMKVYKDKISNLESKIKMLQLQITKSPTRDLELQVQSLQKEVDERDGKIFQFGTERQKYESQISALQNRITDLQVNYQEQAGLLKKEVKRLKDMEVTLRTGVKDVNARDVIARIQEENKKLREEVRQFDKDMKIVDKSAYSFKQQLDQSKRQVHALYNKNRELMIQIQSGSPTKATHFEKGTDLMADAEDLEMEMRDKDRKMNRLESLTKSLEQEITDLKYSLSGRDIKIDEMRNVTNEMKSAMAKAGLKIGVKGKK